MGKAKVLRFIGGALFCAIAVFGLVNVISGKVELSYFRFGNYGNLLLPLFYVCVPALLALALFLDCSVLGLAGGVLGAAFYIYRLSICLPAFLKNIQMTYMSYGMAAIDIFLCLMAFLLATFLYLARMVRKTGKRSFFGLALTSAIFRLLSLVVSVAFGIIMSLTSYKVATKYAFFYPQIKLTGAKCYHVMIGGNTFLAIDVLFVLAFFVMAFAIRGERRR